MKNLLARGFGFCWLLIIAGPCSAQVVPALDGKPLMRGITEVRVVYSQEPTVDEKECGVSPSRLEVEIQRELLDGGIKVIVEGTGFRGPYAFLLPTSNTMHLSSGFCVTAIDVRLSAAVSATLMRAPAGSASHLATVALLNVTALYAGPPAGHEAQLTAGLKAIVRGLVTELRIANQP